MDEKWIGDDGYEMHPDANKYNAEVEKGFRALIEAIQERADNIVIEAITGAA